MSNDEEILDNLFNNHLNSANKLDRDKGIDLIKSLLLNNDYYLKLFRERILFSIRNTNLNKEKWTFR
jgi:hypothetical protein